VSSGYLSLSGYVMLYQLWSGYITLGRLGQVTSYCSV